MSVSTVELVKISNSLHLTDQTKVETIKSHLNTLIENVEKWDGLAEAVTVKDYTDKAGMRMAKQTRLSIRAERIDAIKHIDSMVEATNLAMKDFTEEKKAWQMVAKLVESSAKKYEETLKYLETTFDRHQETIILKVRLERIEQLSLYTQDANAYITDDMSNGEFDTLLATFKTNYEAEQKQKAIEKEQERARIELEIKEKKEQKIIESRKLELNFYSITLALPYPEDAVLLDDDKYAEYLRDIKERYNEHQRLESEKNRLRIEYEARLSRFHQVWNLIISLEANAPNVPKVIDKSVVPIEKLNSYIEQLEHILQVAESEARHKQQRETVIKERRRAWTLLVDEFESLGEGLIEESVNDNMLFDDEHYKNITESLSGLTKETRDKIAEKRLQIAVEQRKALEPYERLIVVRQALEHLPMDEKFFNEITTITIPGLLEKEREAFTSEVDLNSKEYTRNVISNIAETTPLPFQHKVVIGGVQDFLNNKFKEMLNEFIRKANIYLYKEF